MTRPPEITDIRSYEPEIIAQALRDRCADPWPRHLPEAHSHSLHRPARGALGGSGTVMSDGGDLLVLCKAALSQPGVGCGVQDGLDRLGVRPHIGQHMAEMERVVASTTLPAPILGGEVPADPDGAFTGWAGEFTLPHALGLVSGRPLLYPNDGDIERTVDTAVELL